MEQDFDHLRIIRQAARDLALTRAETEEWIVATITEIEKAMEAHAEPGNA